MFEKMILLPIFGAIWAGSVLIVSFLLLFDMQNKPHMALLCTFGAIAAFAKIMACGFLLRAIRRYDGSECRIGLVINSILTVLILLVVLPLYFLGSLISTPFDVIATTVSVAYLCCLLLCIFLVPPRLEESNESLIEASETS